MSSDLKQFIFETPLCDTHEHLLSEEEYLAKPPDIIEALFGHYVKADLYVAGGSSDVVQAIEDISDSDIRKRFEVIKPFWERSKHTGWGEAVQILAKEVYGMEEISLGAIESAVARHEEVIQPGQRYHLLKERASLDHIQIDDCRGECRPDESGRDFFFYDLSWLAFARGTPDPDFQDLKELDAKMETIFAENADCAIAVKSQHAYNRTLLWQERDRSDVEKAVDRYLQDPAGITEADQLCIGDWCLSKGIELSVEYDLPIKIHTGFYAGYDKMKMDYIAAGQMSDLLIRYPDARFVLMHIAYPYTGEILALAKHFKNVYVDLCWAWSISPVATLNFVREYIHAVPSHKLFAFGGDTSFPGTALAYAVQSRNWLLRALQAEVDDGLLTEKGAIALAKAMMMDNQYECFRVEDKRAKLLA